MHTPKRKNAGAEGHNPKRLKRALPTSPSQYLAVADLDKFIQPKHSFNSTSWSYWTEWRHVYSLLFNTLPQFQRIGIARVSAWRSRGTLPVAIESTVALLEATLADAGCTSFRHATSSAVLDSTNSIKLIYACSIVRFVNGILDAKQLAYHPIPLTQLAAENGLPQFLVDVRHQVSHYPELPSLSVLRLSADIALQWLKDKYWDRQTQVLETLQTRIKGILDKYQARMCQLVLDKEISSDYEPTSLLRDSTARIIEVQQYIAQITSISNPNLVHEILVPILLSVDNCNSFLLPQGKYTGYVVPQRLMLTWHIALRKFANVWAHFPFTLLLSLVNQIVDSVKDVVIDKDSREYHMNSLRTSWAVYLLHNFYRTDTSTPNIQPPTALISVANICLKNLNPWTKHILAQICNSADSTTPWEQLKEITALKKIADTLRERRYNITDGPTESSRTIDIHKLEELLNRTRTSADSASVEKDKELVWTRNIQFPVHIPIGMLPNREFPNLDLPTSLDDLDQAQFLVPSTSQNSTESLDDSTKIDQHQTQSSEGTKNNEPKQAANPSKTTMQAPLQQGNVEDNESQLAIPDQTADTVKSLFLIYKELFV